MTTTNTAEENSQQDQIQKLEDELHKRAPRVINHMNDDHQDSIKAYALAFGEHPKCSEAVEAVLTSLDRYGFFLQVTLKDGTTLEKVRVPYQGSVTSANDLHMEAVSMHRLAYDKLGYQYKLVNGYYVQVAKMVSAKSVKTVKANPVSATSVAAVAIVVGGIALIRRRK